MEELFIALESMYPLSDEIRAALVGRCHKFSYRKNVPLLRTGESCDWIAFIEKGLVKCCYDISGGPERIICFLRAGEIACATSSLHALAPSRLSIVALDETIIRKISRIEAEAVAEKFPVFHIHMRKITELQSSQLEQHYLLQAESARERLARIPSLCDWMLKDRRIKQYMIADYLGVDRATVSRWKG